MNRIIEADLLPPPVEETKEKPLILIIDNNRDFTLSAKLGLERTGRYSVWIESDPTLHRTPIVFLTALVTRAEARSGLQIDGHPFLAKPISIPELVEGIERNLPAHAAFR